MLNTSLYDMDIVTEKVKIILKTFPTSIHYQQYIRIPKVEICLDV